MHRDLPLITAIGVSVFLQEFVRLFYGAYRAFPTPNGRSLFHRLTM
jgi:branched-subunit amino acid ABC-type transport system permease component